MMTSRKQTLMAWGRHKVVSVDAYRPERISQVHQCVAQAQSDLGLLAVGAGRSYGDVGLNDQGKIVLSERLDRMLAFDPVTQVLTCEPGVTLKSIQETFLPRGLGLAVTPGTAFATVGGAVANDVHGKNHNQSGSFGHHVQEITLCLANQQTIVLTPKENPEMFWATIGGVGLTGMIEKVSLQLSEMTSTVAMKEQRIANLEEFFEQFRLDQNHPERHYSVGWIDCMARGQSLGRGILQTAYHVAEEKQPHVSRIQQIKLPFPLPNIALNSSSIRCFNHFYWNRVPQAGRECMVPAMEFYYPLDRILDWNKMYGRRGFYQFQCVLPDETAEDGLLLMLEQISKARQGSFLAVIKAMGEAGKGYLSFPMKGITLALDFPKSSASEELIKQLNALTIRYGGRVYLAKDALLTESQFRLMYPAYEDFLEVRKEMDPLCCWQSDLGRRCGLANQ